MVYLITALVLAVVIGVYFFSVAPGRDRKSGNNLWNYSYAHRGLHNEDGSTPENSFSAFAKAVEKGYGIELDIRITADDRIVVFHDDTLNRMCGVDRPIEICTYEELKEYRLLNTDERIPLFSEVLKIADGRVPLIVELKNTSRNDALCSKAAAVLDGYNGAYCIESFNPAIVRWFRKNRPATVRGQLAAAFKRYGTLPFYQKVLLSSLVLNFLCRPNFVAFKHEDSHRKLRLNIFRFFGGRLVAWTVRSSGDYKYCEKHFDSIIFEFIVP